MYFLKFIPNNETVLTFDDEMHLERWLQNSDVYTKQGIFAYNHFCKFMLAIHPNEYTGGVVLKPQVGLHKGYTCACKESVKESVDPYTFRNYKRYADFLFHVDYNSRQYVNCFLSRELGEFVGNTSTDFMLYMRTYIIYDEHGKIYNYMPYIDKRMSEKYRTNASIDSNDKVCYYHYRDNSCANLERMRYQNISRYGLKISKGESLYAKPYVSKDVEDEDAIYDVYNKPLRGKRRALCGYCVSPGHEVYKEHKTWKKTKKRKQWMHGRKETVGRQGTGKRFMYEDNYNREYEEVLSEEDESEKLRDIA